MSTARENSVKQLSELYNVIIGVALSLSIYNIIDADASPIPLNFDIIVNFFTIIVLIVPFYHGAVRHLFATYVEDGGSTKIKNGGLLADFFLLFFEGCLFVVMASVVGDLYSLCGVILALLILDSIWGFLAWLAFTGAGSQYAEQKWAIINVITTLIIFAVLFYSESLFVSKPLMAQFLILGTLSVRTIVDYFLTWDFYFPSE